MTNKVRIAQDENFTTLHLDIRGGFSAAEVEKLILFLGSARAGIQPPVAARPQDDGGAELGRVKEPLSGLVADQPTEEGAQLLRLRSERFGWLTWELGHHDARALGEHLHAFFPPIPGIPTGGAR